MCRHNSSTFTVIATGAGLTYQWERGISDVYAPISGATTPNDGATYSNYNTATLTVANAPIEMDGYTYRCVLSGACSPDAISKGAATLTVDNSPTITTAATPAIVTEVCEIAGIQYTTLGYTATTGSPISYSIDWATLTDQNPTSFPFIQGGGIITDIAVKAYTPANTYTGTLTITNANGCTSTKTITLTVNASPANRAVEAQDIAVCTGSSTSYYCCRVTNRYILPAQE